MHLTSKTFSLSGSPPAVPDPSTACSALCFGLLRFPKRAGGTPWPQLGGDLSFIIVLLLFVLLQQSAHCDELILPGDAATQEGPSFSSYPLLVPNGRVQQFYDSSSFAVSKPVLLLEGVAFRIESSPGSSGPIHETINRLTVILSTTQMTADQYQQGNWEANHGPDRTVAFDGSIRFDSQPASSGAAPFDLKITFTTPFAYDPSKGNLRLDFYHDRSTPGGANIDMFNSFSPLGYGNALGPGGSLVRNTLATEFFFTTIPEPIPLVIGLVSGAGMLVFTKTNSARRI